MFLYHWSAAHDAAIESFVDLLGILKRSVNTIDAYRRTVCDFLRRTTKPLEDLRADDVFNYLVFLNDERKLKARTLNQKRSALAVFFKDILEIPLPRKVLKYSKQPSPIPESLTLTEAADFFKATSDFQLRTLFMTMYAAGLRLAEATHLKPEDIDSKNMVIHVRRGKGMKDRDVILSPKLLEYLRECFRQYRPKTWLFPGRTQKPICHKKVQKACRQAALKAGIQKRVTPHILRHSFAVQLLRNGVNLRYIQELLGHASIETTMIYLRMVPESLDVTSPLDMLDV
jgi:site-specific recombinase XerD